MNLPNFLKKPIYVSYMIGDNEENKIEYIKPHLIYAQKGDIKSLVLREDVGILPNYDMVLLVPYGEKTQFIDEQTLLWVDVMPNSDFSNMDYEIKQVSNPNNDIIVLYCNSIVPNLKPIYYEYGNNVYKVKIDIDFEKLIAFLPFNKYFPINNTTKIWLTKPIDINSVENLIKFVKKQKLNNCYKLIFEKVVND